MKRRCLITLFPSRRDLPVPWWPLCWLTVLVGFLLPCRAAEEDAKLERFFRTYLEEEFQMRPFEATQLGDHRFDHLLDDLSPEARQKQLDHIRGGLQELRKEINYKSLS